MAVQNLLHMRPGADTGDLGEIGFGHLFPPAQGHQDVFQPEIPVLRQRPGIENIPIPDGRQRVLKIDFISLDLLRHLPYRFLERIQFRRQAVPQRHLGVAAKGSGRSGRDILHHPIDTVPRREHHQENEKDRHTRQRANGYVDVPAVPVRGSGRPGVRDRRASCPFLPERLDRPIIFPLLSARETEKANLIADPELHDGVTTGIVPAAPDPAYLAEIRAHQLRASGIVQFSAEQLFQAFFFFSRFLLHQLDQKADGAVGRTERPQQQPGCRQNEKGDEQNPHAGRRHDLPQSQQDGEARQQGKNRPQQSPPVP